MNIESKLWHVKSFNDAYAYIIQKSTGAMRTVMRSTLPSVEELAQMHEVRFNTVLREAFVNAGQT